MGLNLKRVHYGLSAFLLMVATVATIITTAPQARAAALIDFTFSTTSNEAGATADYSFRYKTVSPSNIVWRLSGWSNINFSASTAAVKVNGVSYAIPISGSGYWNGANPYIRVPGLSTIPAGADVEVNLYGVINPSTPGTYTANGLGTATGQGGHIDYMTPSLVVPALAPLSFTSPTTKEVLTDDTLTVNDLAIVGGPAGNPVYNINLYVEAGSLSFGDSTGLTFVGPSSGQQLQLSGTKYHINKALTTLTHTAPSTTGTVKLEALINEDGGGVIWSSNQHAYKVVTVGGGIDWAAAKTAAEAQTFGGVSGYLATITSQEEHEFILTRINQDGWIGGSDAAVEGDWYWMTGPETGQQFWQGAANGQVMNGLFANWNQQGGATEPNNSTGNEDCTQIRFTANAEGRWNDLPCTTTLPNYVVEFGAPGALPEVVQTSFDINVIPYTYTASFDTQGGSEVAPIAGVEEGETITLPATPQRAGYIFEAWTDGEGTYQPGDSFTMPAGDFVFNSIWIEDGNVDVIPDDEQPNVANVTDPTSNKRITIELDASCTLASASTHRADDFAVQDSAYTYDTGFVQFTATGCDDGKTTVTLYYYDVAANDEVVVRKHNPNTNSYFTVSNALLDKRTIVGQNVTVVSYEVTDGGPLDTDGVQNGTIIDPVGLGRQNVAAPNTGANVFASDRASSSVIGVVGAALLLSTTALLFNRVRAVVILNKKK